MTDELRRVSESRWAFGEGFRAGRSTGLTMRDGRLTLADGVADGRWTSPWVRESFGVTELVPSWQARTPGPTWIAVSLRGRTADGRVSDWSWSAIWAETDEFVVRRSVENPPDPVGTSATDTWTATESTGVTAWQLRVELGRPAGSLESPRIDAVGAVASRLDGPVSPSTPSGRHVLLDVPTYSQMTHADHFPEYGGGGGGWCSAASTAMVLDFFSAGPGADELAVIGEGHVDAQVDYAARMTFDATYGGTGNWSFNTAWAATRTSTAYVTRLADLTDAERFVAAGIPLVASVRYGDGDLPGAPTVWTRGHLLVIVGFTAAGDVIVNDPAADTNDQVRMTYPRAAFERVWTGGSGGLVYVIHPGT